MAEQVVISGILPILALSLRNRGPITVLTAKLVAELAKERKFFHWFDIVTFCLLLWGQNGITLFVCLCFSCGSKRIQ